jgi:hypothetical protein
MKYDAWQFVLKSNILMGHSSQNGETLALHKTDSISSTRRKCDAVQIRNHIRKY